MRANGPIFFQHMTTLKKKKTLILKFIFKIEKHYSGKKKSLILIEMICRLMHEEGVVTVAMQ